ncbi:beta-N-acetylhexosaminidase [Lamprocystis purpurea]|jgi:beta-N-acetylhexosaminidase|uniref:beta-N-acetylhexosaminidase n=1 Tax=Lamprocystis purpurea TaxID=61598 RepID=UPI00037028E4|nr:beta-N-acetylhexosaminidase [Lamprocystis purpurea]
MSLGPIMVDLAGPELTAEDRELLRHPAVGGVILFSRNYASPEQLAGLTAAIHALREPRLLIGVDQEGGRVQRFRDGFTRLPAAGRFGALYAADPRRACAACADVAWLMAAELRAAGVDFSFAPVLDLDRGISQVIGDRGFGARVTQVVDLATAWTSGVRQAGMAAVGKHFPGHGGVAADSHTALPIDERDLADLLAADLIPFARLIEHGLEAVMPAHVIYPRVAAEPAGFSAVWLRDLLRGRLGFAGVIFSDDLNMAAADAGGGYVERAQAAARAGCDMLLICNNRPAAVAIVQAFRENHDPAGQLRLLRMHGRGDPEPARLHEAPRWQAGVRQVALLEDLATLDLALDDPTRHPSPT